MPIGIYIAAFVKFKTPYISAVKLCMRLNAPEISDTKRFPLF
jgi:hypothetical protein